jgi:RHS repeat-associated protein
VARVTTTLLSRSRLQRLRLQEGWNLLSLAVTATNVPAQLDAAPPGGPNFVRAVYQWQPGNGRYRSVAANDVINAGSVLWVHSRTNSMTVVQGTEEDPLPPHVPAGGGFIGSAGLLAWSPELPPGVTAWRFAPGSGPWRAGFTGDLTSLSDAPSVVAPGEVIYLHTAQAVDLTPPSARQRVLYYHPDHQGSVAATTDVNGEEAGTMAYHPFGALRQKTDPGDGRALDPHYTFSGKERDDESGLADFGQRAFHPGLGRWLTPDPLFEKGGGPNPYTYVRQNPLKFHDPNGAEIKVVRTIDEKNRKTTYEIHLKAVFMDVSSTKYTAKEVADYAQKLEAKIEKEFTGSGSEKVKSHGRTKEWKYEWKTSVDMRVIDDWSKVEKNDHVFRIVDMTAGGRGDTMLGGMLVNLKANIFKRDPEIYRSAEETGGHEFGHTAGLPHDNSWPNLMMDGSLRDNGVANIGLQQIKAIFEAQEANKLNQREKVMDELDEIARRRR